MLLSKPVLPLITMKFHLNEVRDDTRDVQQQIAEYEQKLAAAEQAGNKEIEKLLSNLLCSLQVQKNILLSQLQSKPCFQLMHTGLHVFISSCAPFSEVQFRCVANVSELMYCCKQLQPSNTLIQL